ncbi:MAG: phosphate-starvation-inducible PsiE family protein [Sulfurihydrogenibium sp.]|uniref:phosphate-starvation-inducible PsiE family protein n=1 Tax=Sulfurihydrogenibium sp. TaxID=2053621 RepID=UPI003D12B405
MEKLKKLLEPHKLHDKLGDLFEFFEDFIIVLLTLLLFILSMMAIYDLGLAVFSSKYSFMDLVPKFLYVFILAELFRLNIVYLQERIIDTSLIIKTTLIAILRELIVKAPSLKLEEYVGVSILLTVLALSYYVPKYILKKERKFRLGKRRNYKKSTKSVKTTTTNL